MSNSRPDDKSGDHEPYYWETCTPEEKARRDADAVRFGQQSERNGQATDETPKKRGNSRVSSAPKPIPAYQPFPLPALPPTLREYVDASAAAIGCDPALVGLPALAVVAGCIGNSRALRLKKGWTETAIVWTVSVAPSGALKSPAFGAAVDPLLEIQMEQTDAHQQEQDDYQQALKEWREKKRDERGAEPNKPPSTPCYITSDATIEAVGELLRDNPRGLLLARDELDGWFQGFTRNKKSGATDRPHWLELSRAGTLRLHRVTRERGPLSVRRACCSITGTIQPVILAQALDRDAMAAGVGARFLMSAPPRRPRRWTEAEVSEELTDRYTKLLRGLLSLQLDSVSTRKPKILQLDVAAKSAFVEWVNAWGERQDAAQDAEAAALAKLEGYAARLALMHSVVSHVAMETDNIRAVGEQSIRAGICLAKWFANEALRVYHSLRESDDQRRLRELVEWVECRGGEVVPWKVSESMRTRYPTSADAELDLEELVKAGHGEWIEQASGDRGGRPKRIFRMQTGAQKTGKTPVQPSSDESPTNSSGAQKTPAEHQKPLAPEGFPGFPDAESCNGSSAGHEQAPEVFLLAPTAWLAEGESSESTRTPFEE
jgi:hypothetical protein